MRVGDPKEEEHQDDLKHAGAGWRSRRYVSPHWLAAQAQAPFAPTASLRILSPENPWRPNSDGHRFYSALLAADLTNATIQTAIDIGAPLGLRYSVQDHLRWLFTWGPYIEIDGKRSAHWSQL